MADIEIQGNSLIVRLHGWSAVWALKKKIEIPLSSIQTVKIDPEIARHHPRGIRAPGTYLPRVITAGTYRWRRGREFWSVRRPDKAIVIDLVNSPYKRLILEVADPLEAMSTIEAAGR